MGNQCRRCLKNNNSENRYSPKMPVVMVQTTKPARQIVTKKFIANENAKMQGNTNQMNQGIKWTSKNGDSQQTPLAPEKMLNSSCVVFNGSLCEQGKHYILIDQLAYIPKSNKTIKVVTPTGQVDLDCSRNDVCNAMFIALGIPIDIIQVGDANSNSVISAIANSDSLIEVKMKLKCPKCLTSRKMTFCKALINLEDVICPECDAKVVWELKDIQSNVPIWSQGKKLVSGHLKMKVAPTFLRAMGCVFCFRFSDCMKLECGCLICRKCMLNNGAPEECNFCKGAQQLQKLVAGQV